MSPARTRSTLTTDRQIHRQTHRQTDFARVPARKTTKTIIIINAAIWLPPRPTAKEKPPLTWLEHGYLRKAFANSPVDGASMHMNVSCVVYVLHPSYIWSIWGPPNWSQVGFELWGGRRRLITDYNLCRNYKLYTSHVCLCNNSLVASEIVFCSHLKIAFTPV